MVSARCAVQNDGRTTGQGEGLQTLGFFHRLMARDGYAHGGYAGGHRSSVSGQRSAAMVQRSWEWVRPWERTVEVSAVLCYAGRGVTLVDLTGH